MKRFFIGLHHPADACRFDAAFISVNTLRGRKGDFQVGDWIMDSGAFSEISRFGDYRFEVSEYALQIERWKRCGNLLAAVTQDYMCEAFILEKTGLTIEEHQQKTIARYDELCRYETGVYIMPVLQGYQPEDYVRHVSMYGSRLAEGAWVGVGSVCKRNSDPKAIEEVLLAIKRVRPDLKLHGFGLKKTALTSAVVEQLLESGDSMAWSFHARMHGRNGNSWEEAKRWLDGIERRPIQYPLAWMLEP